MPFPVPVPETSTVVVPLGTSTLSTPVKAEPLCGGASGAGNGSILSANSGAEPPSYPPSEVRNWMICPTFWRDSRNWEPRADRWTPHALVGTAIHAGYATWLRERESELSVTERRNHALDAGQTALQHVCIETGTPALGTANWPIEELQQLVTKGIWAVAFGHDEPLAHVDLLAIEQPLQDGSIPDYVYRERTSGTIGIADLKTTYKQDAQWIPQTLADTVHSWQLWHYAWRWTYDHKCYWGHSDPTMEQVPSELKTILLVLTPRTRLYTYDHHPTREQVIQWGERAQDAWAQMRQDSTDPAEVLGNYESCRGRYGRCEMYDACHVLDLDPERMKALYEQKVPHAAR